MLLAISSFCAKRMSIALSSTRTREPEPAMVMLMRGRHSVSCSTALRPCARLSVGRQA